MNILVTAGNTQTPLDRVRCITNIFSGRTGARIAAEAAARGHRVTLLTSHPEVLEGEPSSRDLVPVGLLRHEPYLTNVRNGFNRSVHGSARRR